MKPGEQVVVDGLVGFFMGLTSGDGDLAIVSHPFQLDPVIVPVAKVQSWTHEFKIGTEVRAKKLRNVYGTILSISVSEGDLLYIGVQLGDQKKLNPIGYSGYELELALGHPGDRYVIVLSDGSLFVADELGNLTESYRLARAMPYANAKHIAKTLLRDDVELVRWECVRLAFEGPIQDGSPVRVIGFRNITGAAHNSEDVGHIDVCTDVGPSVVRRNNVVPLRACGCPIWRNSCGCAEIEATTPVVADSLNLDAEVSLDEVSTAEQARALHRVVRAMHDGHCPSCGHLWNVAQHPAKLDESGFAEYVCPSCNFTISPGEAREAIAEFAPYLKKSLKIFDAWSERRERVQSLKRKAVFTLREIANLLGEPWINVSRWFDSSRLRGYRIPGTQDRRVPKAALIEFLKSESMQIPEGLE